MHEVATELGGGFPALVAQTWPSEGLPAPRESLGLSETEYMEMSRTLLTVAQPRLLAALADIPASAETRAVLRELWPPHGFPTTLVDPPPWRAPEAEEGT
jgi:hypothetical protein